MGERLLEACTETLNRQKRLCRSLWQRRESADEQMVDFVQHPLPPAASTSAISTIESYLDRAQEQDDKVDADLSTFMPSLTFASLPAVPSGTVAGGAFTIPLPLG